MVLEMFNTSLGIEDSCGLTRHLHWDGCLVRMSLLRQGTCTVIVCCIYQLGKNKLRLFLHRGKKLQAY